MAGKNPGKPTPAGGGEAKPKGKAKVAFPRSPGDELQEALGHLEYFKNQSWALTFAFDQITKDLRLCESETAKWTARAAKLEDDNQ
jgi:hypothetical protein